MKTLNGSPAESESKATITPLEADRMEANARAAGAQAAIAQGGDPASIAGLMRSGDGFPKVMGHELRGIHGGSYTAAFLVASAMLAKKFTSEDRVINALVDMITLINPRAVWELLQIDDLEGITKMAQAFAFETEMSLEGINEFNRQALALTKGTESAAPDGDESFTKPEEPATSSAI